MELMWLLNLLLCMLIIAKTLALIPILGLIKVKVFMEGKEEIRRSRGQFVPIVV